MPHPGRVPLFLLLLVASTAPAKRALQLAWCDVGEQWAIHEIESAGGFAMRHGNCSGLTRPPEWLIKSSEVFNSWLRLPRGARITPSEWRVFNPVVNIECREVDGTTLRSIGHLKYVRRLYLPEATSADYLISQLSRMKQLELLELFGSDVSDESVATIRRLPGLQKLVLAFTPITDSGVRQLANHPTLRILNLGGTQITDESLPVFKTLPKLEELYLDYTPVTEDAYRKLKAELPGVVVTWWSDK